MSTQLNANAQGKPGWDHRAWWIALASCVVSVTLMAVVVIPSLRNQVSDNLQEICGLSGLAVTFLIFPPVLSGIARRRTFFWAYPPMIAFGLLVLIVSVPDLFRMYFDPESVPNDLWIGILEMIGISVAVPVVTAGPVCLFRVLRRRAETSNGTLRSDGGGDARGARGSLAAGAKGSGRGAMSTGQRAQSKVKLGSDKRAWKLAAVFCVVIAGLFVGGLVLVTSSFEYVYASVAMLGISIAMSLLVCPPILAGVARRRWLLWAYVPWLAFIASTMIASVIQAAMPQPTPPPGTVMFYTATETTIIGRMEFGFIAVFLLSPLVSASPVCLYRALRHRARTNEIEHQAAIDKAIHSHQEGVWPPAPKDQGVEQ